MANVEELTQPIPEWIKKFDGPFNAYSVEEVINQFLAAPRIITWQKWAQEHLKNGLGTMVVPQLYFEDGKPILKFCLYFSSPEEALRMGRAVGKFYSPKLIKYIFTNK